MYKYVTAFCVLIFAHATYSIRDPFSFGNQSAPEQVVVQSVEVCRAEKKIDEISEEKKSSEWKVVEHLPDGTLIQNSDGSIRKIKLLK